MDKKQMKLKGLAHKANLGPVLKRVILDIIKNIHDLDDEQDETVPM